MPAILSFMFCRPEKSPNAGSNSGGSPVDNIGPSCDQVCLTYGAVVPALWRMVITPSATVGVTPILKVCTDVGIGILAEVPFLRQDMARVS